MTALAKCPFCGEIPDRTDSIATDSGAKSRIGKWAWVECGCGVRGPETRAGYGGLEGWQDEAIAAWNRRALPSREEVAEVIDDCVRVEWTPERHWHVTDTDKAADAVLALMKGETK